MLHFKALQKKKKKCGKCFKHAIFPALPRAEKVKWAIELSLLSQSQQIKKGILKISDKYF